MLHRLVAPFLALLLGLQTVAAQDATVPADELFAALKLNEIIDVMRSEGIAYGASISADLFPGEPGPGWAAQVELIYDTERMTDDAMAAFRAELDGADLTPMLAFFNSEPGLSFAALEVSARAALLDDAVEEASREVAALAAAENGPRYQLLAEFAEANDLIETNVVGAMNANYAFYLGLIDGGAAQPGLTTDEVLATVWDQEDQIRQTTTEWVMSFLLMAYQPLSDADIQAYIDFSRTPAGRDMNRAVFTAFDGMFVDISRALGLAAAGHMVGDTL